MSPEHPLVLLLVCVVLASAGCSALGGGPPPSDPAAEHAVDHLVRANESVTAYRATGDGRAVASKGDREKRLSYTRKTVVNRTTHRGRVTSEANDQRKTLYLLGDSAYRLCGLSHYSNVPDAWYPALAVGRDWRSNDTLGRFVGTLDDANVRTAGRERVGETNATVVVARPDAADVRRARREFKRLNGARVGSIHDARYRAWIANGSGRLLRLRTVVNSTTKGVSLSQRLTLRYRYGRNVTVSPPANVTGSADDCPTIEDANT